MKRVAVAAVVGAIAFGTPVVRAPSVSKATTVSATGSHSETVVQPRAGLARQPTAEEDERAMQAATDAAREITLRASRAGSRAVLPDDVWHRLADCESNGNAAAVSRSGKYRGAFQFSIPTWRSLGYAGDPINHPYTTQLAAAKKLQARSGWGQWPACARRLGLSTES